MHTNSPVRTVAHAATKFCTVAFLLFAPAFAPAHEYTAGALQIDHPCIRETPPAATVGAGFLKITNGGRKADALVAVSSPAAARVEIHETRMDGGVMRMRSIARLELPAGRSVVAAPGGLHLMLIGLKSPLKAGERVKATLQFERSGSIEVEFHVSKTDPDATDHSEHAAH
jgi:copper(I)-binding protein